MRYILFSFFTLFLLLAACGKKKCVDFTEITYSVGYFDSLEMAQMKHLKYEKGSSFSRLLSISTNPYGVRRLDNGQFYILGFFPLDATFDHLVLIGNRTFKLHNFYTEQRKVSREGLLSGQDACYNTIHYTMNDSSYTVTPGTYSQGTDYVRIPIHP